MKNMKKAILFYVTCLMLAGVSLLFSQSSSHISDAITRFPANNAVNVNPDTHLELTFPSAPTIGDSGEIRVYCADNDSLVDILYMNIPAGPTKPTPCPGAIYNPVPYKYESGNFTNANTLPGTPSGLARPTPFNYQLTIIGGFTDGFHFYPIIVHDSTTATLYLHNNLLQYNKTYYVQIDSGVINTKDRGFKGFSGKTDWVFTTKSAPPDADADWLVVNSDGSGDFNTVQGAMDFIPDFYTKPVTVFIKNGDYEEIVYFRNKTNVTILGESRDGVVVHYANSEVFNPHPLNLKTNEWPGTFPSRRAAFMVDNSSNINLVNLTIKTTCFGQAEGLLVSGEKILVSNVTIGGSGDALQTNGTAYYVDSRIDGHGDTILGRGAAFFQNCIITSYGPYMWIRNTDANHGNVFVNCTFDTQGERETTLARAPENGGFTYPYIEAVLINCALNGITPAGWGQIGGDPSNVRYWEYNSTNLSDGKPVDVSQRHPDSRQLDKEKDAEHLTNYTNPAYVLGGWTPQLAPIILSQPQSISVKKGQSATLEVKVAAVPRAEYQWYRNGKAIKGATKAVYKISKTKSKDAAEYTVEVKNRSGSMKSQAAVLTVL